VNGRDVLKFMILGLPIRAEPVSQVSRARELHPSFIIVWIGNNDVLDMATSTNPDAVTLTPADLGARFRTLLDALADTGAGMAIANLPDPSGIAALRRAGADVTSCLRTDGTIAPVAADDLVSIDADPARLQALPCTRVLDASGRARVRAKVIAFNEQIASAVADTENARGVAIASVDMFGVLDQLEASGLDLNGDGTPDVTTNYLGGIFSLDGIHPTRTGNALIANAFIQAIDARFGESIPLVDVARVASYDPLAHSRFRPVGEVPFGVIADDGGDAEPFFMKTFTRVEDNINTLRDTFHRVFNFF
jgi:lysophospholipase L1-like esterase